MRGRNAIYIRGVVNKRVSYAPTKVSGCISMAVYGKDKRLELVPGDHYLQEPASARTEIADLLVGWLEGQGA